MTGGKFEPVRIVRYESIPSAPTGESERFIASDGRVYHPVRPFEKPVATLENGTIKPIYGA